MYEVDAAPERNVSQKKIQQNNRGIASMTMDDLPFLERDLDFYEKVCEKIPIESIEINKFNRFFFLVHYLCNRCHWCSFCMLVTEVKAKLCCSS